MPKSSLIVDATDQSGKKLQKTITNINPDVSNSVLASLGSMLVGLSDNTYGNTWRIDKTNCDAEAGGGIAPNDLRLCRPHRDAAVLRLPERSVGRTDVRVDERDRVGVRRDAASHHREAVFVESDRHNGRRIEFHGLFARIWRHCGGGCAHRTCAYNHGG